MASRAGQLAAEIDMLFIPAQSAYDESAWIIRFCETQSCFATEVSGIEQS
jgi:hypothetical protein